MTDSDVVLPFGKQLAANEKKTRDKAVRSLQQFLSSKAELSEKDLLKLWKGLFYCFWMSDKPLIQQSLSETLGSLIMSLQQQNAIAFLGAFWQIHCEEWHGIDRIREHNWDLGIIDDYSELLKNGPLHPTNNKIPDSIRYHLSDIYLGELEKVVNAQLDTLDEDEDIEIPTTELLDPFINLLAKTPNKVTAKKVTENTFIPILEKFAAELLFMEKQMQREGSEDDDSEDDNRPPFIYDVESLEQALGKAAEHPESYNPNRKKLTELRKRFSELIPGEEGDSDDEEVPTLVDAEEEEEEELEDMDEDDEEARKGGWSNEFTAGDIIGHELKEKKQPLDTRRTRKDNGLLGGKMVSVDSSTIDISGLETEVAPLADEEPKTKKKKAKKAAKQPEAEIIEEEIKEITSVVDEDDEDDMITATTISKKKKTTKKAAKQPEVELVEEEETTSVVEEDDEDDMITATTLSKKKKVQWVLDQNTIRRFQKQRPITSVVTAIEPKVARPMKSAIRIRAAQNGDEDEEPKSNGTKKRKAGAKNGDAKRKKATDFF
ncbi:nucleolar protein,Nop52-domain-containing protein [Umbelopsis sp. AD052]|nr:nucleolar protein,Nop52-domain-containing protein [Umbelopsis sp. AD052]